MKFSTKIKELEDGVKEIAIRNEEGSPLVMKFKNVRVASVGDDILLEVASAGGLAELEGEVLGKAKECKESWFGKALADARIESAFSPSYSVEGGLLSVRPSESMKYYDSKLVLTEDAVLAEDSRVDVVVQLSGVHFLQKSFEPVWVLHQVKFRSAARKSVAEFSECMFEEEQDEDEDEFF